ncbi:MAG: hypothetical protein ABH879_04885 [archaeon]
MRIFISLMLVMAVLPSAFAAEMQVVVNSKDWRDVYSGTLYGYLTGNNVKYIVDESHGIDLITKTLGRGRPVLLIESADNPQIAGYSRLMASEGFTTETISSENPLDTNLRLAEMLVSERDIRKYIVIDDTLGFSAMSVASYAILTNSSVLFANKDNYREVYDFLSEHADEILVYGQMNRLAKEELARLNPEFLNLGDKYADNTELARLFLKVRPEARQVIFADGRYIEHSLFSGEYPTVFLGVSNIPPEVIEFINTSLMKTAIVIGYDLYPNSIRIRELTGIKIYLKFARGVAGETYALEVFELPAYNPKVGIKGTRYNAITSQIEVVYENTGDVYTYLQGISHEIFTGENESVGIVGSDEPMFIDAGEIKAVTYDIDLGRYLEERLLVKSITLYGDSPKSLDRMQAENNIVEIISIDDKSEIAVKSIAYRKSTKRFEITVENLGPDLVYTDAEIEDIIIAEERATLSGEQISIPPGKEGIIKIRASLEPVDIEDNPTITTVIRYGARSDALLKSITEKSDLVVIGGIDPRVIVISGMAAGIGGLALLIFLRPRM